MVPEILTDELGESRPMNTRADFAPCSTSEPVEEKTQIKVRLVPSWQPEWKNNQQFEILLSFLRIGPRGAIEGGTFHVFCRSSMMDVKERIPVIACKNIVSTYAIFLVVCKKMEMQ